MRYRTIPIVAAIVDGQRGNVDVLVGFEEEVRTEEDVDRVPSPYVFILGDSLFCPILNL